jgi:hypothetical protein
MDGIRSALRQRHAERGVRIDAYCGLRLEVLQGCTPAIQSYIFPETQ